MYDQKFVDNNSIGIIPHINIAFAVADGSGEPAINASARIENEPNSYAVANLDGKITMKEVNSFSKVIINYMGNELSYQANQIPAVVRFSAEPLEPVIIKVPKPKNYKWLGWLGLGVVGVFVGKAMMSDNPVKVKL